MLSSLPLLVQPQPVYLIYSLREEYQYLLNLDTNKDTNLIAKLGSPLQECLTSILIDHRSPHFWQNRL